LTGQVKSFNDVREFQKMDPRFHEENFHRNLELISNMKFSTTAMAFATLLSAALAALAASTTLVSRGGPA
jgi:hypothetical protein